MERCTDATKLQIGAGFYISLATAILIVPIQWVASWLIAAAAHELGHYLAVLACKHKVYSVMIGCHGAIMETESLGRDEWICALAGPACGLALLSVASWFPKIAICGAVQSAFNLMPIATMDGGRIFIGLLRFFIPNPIAEKISSAASYLMLMIIFAIGLFLFVFCNMGILPLVIGAGLAIKFIKIKFPCKDGSLRVQ